MRRNEKEWFKEKETKRRHRRKSRRHYTMSWKQHTFWLTAGQHIKCKWVCSPEVRRWKTKRRMERKMWRKKSLRHWIPGVTHLRLSHTHMYTHLLEPRQAAHTVLLPAGIFCKMKSVSAWESLALHSYREMSWKTFWPQICLITFQPISLSIKKDWLCLVRLGVKECRGHRYGLGLCVLSTWSGCVLLCLFGCCKGILHSLWGIGLQAF